ncbi:MAG: hypothetical protein SPL80_04300, partial [Bacilli bacterium]|nr:hypothetical protein [Bacilli bacterium]
EVQAGESLRDSVGFTAGDVIYLKVNDAWKADGAKFSLYFFDATNGASVQWSPFLSTKTKDANYFKYELEAKFTDTYNKVIAVRIDPALSEPNWSWNKTADMTAGADKNCICFPDTVYDGGGSWECYTETRYTLHIGDKTAPMELNPTNEYQVFATIENASAGELVSVAKNDQDPGDIHSDGKYSNNIYANNCLKVGGDITVYMYYDSWVSWVTGYAPENNIPLQNFCDELLGKSISDGVCNLNAGSWNALKDRWNGTVIDNPEVYNLSKADRDAFRDAVAKDGNGQSYDSVVQEAKTRYLWMVRNKGAEDFAGFLTAAKETVPLTEGGNGALATSIIVGCSAIALGGLFLLRKKSAE